MRTLTLVRHGRADWKDPRTADFDRPLDRRGVSEASAMARRLADHDEAPDCILASPAQRTRQTAAIFARLLEVSDRRIVWEDRLYLAACAELLTALRGLGPRVGHAMLIGHNPGLSELAQHLAPAAEIGELPTGAVCRLVLDAPDWGAIERGTVVEVACEVPKARLLLR